MAEEDLLFPDGVTPYSYSEMKKYDLSTALHQGTLFPLLDDHYHKRVQMFDERAGNES